ncbi:MAG TPA: branched-chain amino acid ABC transporter substrate-binding protein [Actinomycetota bacterium]
MRKKIIRIAAVLVALTLVAAACGSDDDTGQNGAKKTVKIGFIGDLTGANSALVVPGRNAAQLAFEQANAAGTLAVTIEFVPLDNKEADSAKAPPLAQQLIGDQAVVGVIGPAFSGETSAVQPLFAQAGLTHVSQSATRADLTAGGKFKTFFRAVGGDADQAEAAARLAVKGKGCNTLAIIDDKTAYGKGYADIVDTNAKKYGGQVVTRESVSPTTDYTSLVDTLRSSNPKCVVYGGYQPQSSILIKQMRQKSVTAQFISGDGTKSTKYIPDAGAANAEGTLMTCPCLDANVSVDEGAKKFVADYKAKFNTAPDIYAPEAYDVAQIFIKAIGECGDAVTRACVLDKVTSLKDFKGLTKTFNWTTDTAFLHEVTDKGVSIYSVKNGQIVLDGNINDIVPA